MDKLQNNIDTNCDTALMTLQLYQSMQHDLEGFVRKSSHAQRFKALLATEDDVRYCLQFNTAPVLALMQGEYLINATPVSVV